MTIVPAHVRPARWLNRAYGLALIAALAVAGWTALPRPVSAADTRTVARVVDGDTFDLRDGTRVRVIGVNTPETRPVPQCFGLQAKQLTASVIPPGSRVRLSVDREPRDRYGRALRYVAFRDRDGTWRDLGAFLLRRGAARTMIIPPNDSRADLYAGLEARARAAGRGLWGVC